MRTSSSSKELVVPVGLMMIVGCMIIPLPSAVLDVFLVSNLLFALLLVIGALQIKDPLKIAALPSLLLMATLFRLSLNLATTRAALSSGHAGQAVEAFGSIVIQGNLIVGFVLFLLITMVQFVVVAKGSERVAEVAARFTLDALPGKQMSLDADIRSGSLDPASGRKKRAEIQTESRFYGALDGAMKFVKGDAIAGLIITLVNICGGLLVGVVLQGLEIEVALHKYTVLTIGDGLLSQIPSLLNSVAAGLVVTRVQVDESSSLASDLLSQVLQFTVARGFVAGAALLLGILPGMPHLALLSLSGLLIASLLYRKEVADPDQSVEQKSFEPSLAQTVQIEVNQELVSSLPALSKLSESLEQFRDFVFSRWGIVLERPGMCLWKESTGEYRILVRGMEVLVSCRNIGEADLWHRIEQDLRQVVEQFRVELIDDAITRRALDYVEKQAPDLVSSVVPNTLTLTQCTSLLRSLLREQVTIRHLDVVLQTVAECGARTSERGLLVEVRVALRLVISRQVAVNQVVRAIVLDPLLDLVLAKAEESESLADGQLVERITQGVEALGSDGVVVVASKRARAYVRDVLRAKGIQRAVIAHEEIAPGFKVEVVESMEINDEQERLALMEGLVG
jgi:type III secretion protein V